MTDRLSAIRDQCTDIASAIRWACVLEATAPKVGNVHPGCGFHDLGYQDFVRAADIAAERLTQFELPLGRRILSCVTQTQFEIGTNVNLGIVLLIAPLAQAHRQRVGVSKVLSQLDNDDGQHVFRAISAAGVGGLQSVDTMDVYQEHACIDLIDAMTLAADRDRIALQYATGFDDLNRHVVPILQQQITAPPASPLPNLLAMLNRHVAVESTNPPFEPTLLDAISVAHLRLLAHAPDSLIARKGGKIAAERVQQRAMDLDLFDGQAVTEFDRWLRSDGNVRNPGTTADLIAAALFVLITKEE